VGIKRCWRSSPGSATAKARKAISNGLKSGLTSSRTRLCAGWDSPLPTPCFPRSAISGRNTKPISGKALPCGGLLGALQGALHPRLPHRHGHPELRGAHPGRTAGGCVQGAPQTNPFPSICGRVCDHPCESKCRRSTLDEPVSIKNLKRFITDHGTRPPVQKPTVARKEKIAVVGGGRPG